MAWLVRVAKQLRSSYRLRISEQAACTPSLPLPATGGGARERAGPQQTGHMIPCHWPYWPNGGPSSRSVIARGRVGIPFGNGQVKNQYHKVALWRKEGSGRCKKLKHRRGAKRTTHHSLPRGEQCRASQMSCVVHARAGKDQWLPIGVVAD